MLHVDLCRFMYGMLALGSCSRRWPHQTSQWLTSALCQSMASLTWQHSPRSSLQSIGGTVIPETSPVATLFRSVTYLPYCALLLLVALLLCENVLTDWSLLVPLKPNSSNYYTLPYRSNLPFLISDIRALWRSALSARVPECQKLKM